MVTVKEYIKQQYQRVSVLPNNYDRIYLDLSFDQFSQLFKIFGKELLVNRGQKDKNLIIDEGNRELFFQLFYYLSGNEKFNGSLSKGILLVGPYGVGKTLMMKTFCQIVNGMTRQKIKILQSKDLANAFISRANYGEIPNENIIEKYKRRRLFIDDIGKESVRIINFGNEIHPFIDLLSARYEVNSWTFGTSNFNIKDLSERYTGHIGERIKEMFNIIELKGKSRRK